MGIEMNDHLADTVDTSAQDEVILVIDAATARRGNMLDGRFDRIVRDLVMGVPVAGRDLDDYGIAALGFFTEAEAAALDGQADLFEYERAY